MIIKRCFLPRQARVGRLPRLDNQTKPLATLYKIKFSHNGKITISQLSTHGYWSEILAAASPSTPIIIIIISLTSIFFQDKSRVWTAASQQH